MPVGPPALPSEGKRGEFSLEFGVIYFCMPRMSGCLTITGFSGVVGVGAGDNPWERRGQPGHSQMCGPGSLGLLKGQQSFLLLPSYV